MATEKKYKYDYKKVGLYFDTRNPLQKEAFNLLEKAGHKKTLLIGILVHHFLQQFGQTELSETDLKNYIQSYETICKANMGIPFMQPYASPMNIPPVLQDTPRAMNASNMLNNSKPENKGSISDTPKDEPVVLEPVALEEDMDYINAMMGGFSL